ncbi:MAG: hypothetical protein ACON5H_07770 [Akkermansiaceae bacterium]
MTRSQFILGVALLVVAGTLAFTVSFRKQEERDRGRVAEALEARLNQRGTSSNNQSQGRLSSDRRISLRSAERARYEVTVADLGRQPSADKIQLEALDQLEEMTNRYQLTGSQRRQIFPLLAKHHPEFQEEMMVNGRVLPPPTGGRQLASEVYPLLDPSQQDLYQDDLLSRDRWWSEIISQLREDLDGAIASGEMVAVDENGVEIPATLLIDENPAEGHGTAIENNGGGINLDRLIGQ